MFRARKRSLRSPCVGVEVGETVDIKRAYVASEIASLYQIYRNELIPGFVVSTAALEEIGVAESGDSDVFDVLTRSFGCTRKGDDLPHFALPGAPSSLHTDKHWLLPIGAETRLHRSNRGARVRIGRIAGVVVAPGTEFQEVKGAGFHIPVMYEGDVQAAEVTVFRLSSDVLHQFSSPAIGEEPRRYHIRAIGSGPSFGN